MNKRKRIKCLLGNEDYLTALNGENKINPLFVRTEIDTSKENAHTQENRRAFNIAPTVKPVLQTTPVTSKDTYDYDKVSPTGDFALTKKGVFLTPSTVNTVSGANTNKIPKSKSSYNINNNTKNNWFKNTFSNKDTLRNTFDTIGNIGAGLADMLGNFSIAKAIGNQKYYSSYVPEIAQKLKTTYNINPQVSELRRQFRNSVRDINANTASSSTGLNRIRNARANFLSTYNQLYGTKENEETKLINADVLNRQEVGKRNTERLSADIKARGEFENNKLTQMAQYKANGINSLFKAANSSIHDWTNFARNREKDENTLAIQAIINPGSKNILDQLYKGRHKDQDTYIKALRNLPSNYKFQSSVDH